MGIEFKGIEFTFIAPFKEINQAAYEVERKRISG